MLSLGVHSEAREHLKRSSPSANLLVGEQEHAKLTDVSAKQVIHLEARDGNDMPRGFNPKRFVGRPLRVTPESHSAPWLPPIDETFESNSWGKGQLLENSTILFGDRRRVPQLARLHRQKKSLNEDASLAKLHSFDRSSPGQEAAEFPSAGV